MHSASGPDTWTQFALAAFRVNAALIDAGNDIVRPIGQTSARWQILGRVHEPQTVSAVAHAIGHARQSVQRLTDTLAAQGLVRYVEHPTDRRTKLVELTATGAAVMASIHSRQVEWSQQIMETLDAEKLASTTRALNEVSSALEAAHIGTIKQIPER